MLWESASASRRELRGSKGSGRIGGLDFHRADLEVSASECPCRLQGRAAELNIHCTTSRPTAATPTWSSVGLHTHRDSKYERWSASNPTMFARKRTNPPATTPKGMGAIKRTTGPNPTTLANATGQAQS